MSDTILRRVWKVRVKRSVEKPMMNSNTEKEFSLAKRIVAMRQLTAEDISKVSGGMMPWRGQLWWRHRPGRWRRTSLGDLDLSILALLITIGRRRPAFPGRRC